MNDHCAQGAAGRRPALIRRDSAGSGRMAVQHGTRSRSWKADIRASRSNRSHPGAAAGPLAQEADTALGADASASTNTIGPKQPLDRTACCAAPFPEADAQPRRCAIRAVNLARFLDLPTSPGKCPIDLVCRFGNGGIRHAKNQSRLFIARLRVPRIDERNFLWPMRAPISFQPASKV